MVHKVIRYREGYKYQLTEDYVTTTRIRPISDIRTKFIYLSKNGELIISSGYAWDGPSGPTIDTPSSMRPSLGHDAKYQLMREGFIDQKWRKVADEELKEECEEDGMSHFRAEAWYIMVREFAGFAAAPGDDRVILEAP